MFTNAWAPRSSLSGDQTPHPDTQFTAPVLGSEERHKGDASNHQQGSRDASNASGMLLKTDQTEMV